MRECRAHVGGGEFHSDIKCKLVLQRWRPGRRGQRVEQGGGTAEMKGVSWEVKVCFSRNEVKMDATAAVQTALSISLALSAQV